MDLPSAVVQWVDTVLPYWIRVFGNAAVATWSLVSGAPLATGIVGILLAVLPWVLHRWRWDRETVMADIRPFVSSLIVLGAVVFVVFVFFLMSAPARLHEQQRQKVAQAEKDQAELVWARERVRDLVHKLPPPGFSPRQREILQVALRKAGPRTVIIQYVDTPYSRAGGYAHALADVFRSAVWHADIYPIKPVAPGQHQGLAIKLESITAIRLPQQIVIDAFKQAEVPYRILSGGDVADRVELLIGEM